jgi:hypothetical protein
MPAEKGCAAGGMSLPGDTLLQPCADDPLIQATSHGSAPSNRCTSSPGQMPDAVAPFEQSLWRLPPIVHKGSVVPRRTAIATLAHRSRNTSRFLANGQVDNATDVLPCIVILQSLALREIGEFGPEVDIVLIHSQMLPEQLKLVAQHGVKLKAAGPLPPVHLYGSEFEAATMLKVDVAGLHEYDRVLFLDIDMLPKERLVQHLSVEYADSLVAFPGPSSPVSGQIFVLRPEERMHRLLRHLADTRGNFSIARGWEGRGLLTWPDADGTNSRAQCNATYAKRGSHVDPFKRRRCTLWPFWVERCFRSGVTSWNFMHAGSDQGLLWYAYNLSSLAPGVRTITTKPTGSDGKHMLLGLPFWVHMQGLCKPWLATRDVLSRSKCLKANAFFWHGVWSRFRASHGLDQKCPTLAHAYERFIRVAPLEANRSCFWSNRCFHRYKPKWVVD